MIDLMKNFFGRGTKDCPKREERVTSQDIRIASCALLLEMSNIDGEFSETERENIIRD